MAKECNKNVFCFSEKPIRTRCVSPEIGEYFFFRSKLSHGCKPKMFIWVFASNDDNICRGANVDNINIVIKLDNRKRVFVTSLCFFFWFAWIECRLSCGVRVPRWVTSTEDLLQCAWAAVDTDARSDYQVIFKQCSFSGNAHTLGVWRGIPFEPTYVSGQSSYSWAIKCV